MKKTIFITGSTDGIGKLAVSEAYNEVTGKYFDNDRGALGQAHRDAYDEIKIDRLIHVTEELLVGLGLGLGLGLGKLNK